MVTKIVIFGTGLFYLRRKDSVPKDSEIVAFIDNNTKTQGQYFEGIMVYAPQDISRISYDKIVLASTSSMEMRNELLSLGVPETAIMYWEQYVSEKSHGILVKYNVNEKPLAQSKKKALVIVPIINYAGGFLAALYAALALKNDGYDVVVAAPTANVQTISEVNERGINVWLCPSLPYIEEMELDWIQQFDFILVNSLQNMICVSKIGERKPVLWWLHESRNQYESIIAQYGSGLKTSLLKRISIYAVSDLARNHFLEFYPEEKVGILSFGLPDFYKNNSLSGDKIIIALIGTIFRQKNQIGMIHAIKKLSIGEKNQIECWLIGRDGNTKYRKELDELVSEMPQVKICGEMSRKEIEEAFGQIDVIACPSFEETMSIAIVEGMMNKKICIASNNTGIAEFIRDGENGFVYEAEKEDELVYKLKHIIHNYESLEFMKTNARETYEKYFSMEKFSDNLRKTIT